MAAISVDPSSRLHNNLEQVSSSIKNNNHGVVVIEEVEGCVIMSINYRLAPETRLPGAYEDAGDSAGGNIAYNVTTRLVGSNYKPLCVKGTIFIQPFFGGEARTGSEKQYGTQQQMPNSALTLSASDTYWRLSLPLRPKG
ncbi:hypothetical protein EZV62_015638 [Acer yangbiense]|uniref:Alpha/beta hydrolase fold-3 domain-containing protein n=1 Tax=Acer yangbiense TaxID=1000413 RepID=A0A5C7HM08_9ROSI|nr:hypothetical protein EZV62_015638 [Acer yangbiense]